MVGFIVVVAVADESNILSVGAGEDVGDNLSNMLCVVGGNMVKKKAARHQRLHRNLHEMGIGNRKDPSSTAGQDKNQAEIWQQGGGKGEIRPITMMTCIISKKGLTALFL